jgi:hypothetical protein
MLSTFMMLRINGRGGDLADNHLAVVDAVLRTRRAARTSTLSR